MRAALLCKPPPKNPPPTQLHLRSLGVQRGCSNGSRISAMVGVSVVAVVAVDPSVQVALCVLSKSLWDVLCAPRLGQVRLQLLSTS